MSLFEEVLPAFREGKSIRRRCWDLGNHMWYVTKSSVFYKPTLDDVLATDWEVVKEKVKKTVWVNMYREENMIVARGTFGTKEEAERCKIAVLSHCLYLGVHEITVEVEE